MNKAGMLKFFLIAAVSVTIALIPSSAVAQRGGGHMGGGGFHGGGGGFHGGSFGGFHGGGFGSGARGRNFSGGNFGGFHGGNFGGFRGGNFGGFRGGFRGRGFRDFDDGFFFGGFPGFGFDIGFGFGPWWGWDAYPYWYGYGPGWGPYAYGYPPDPYYYPPYPYRDDPYYYRRRRHNDDDRDQGHDDYRYPDYRHDNTAPSSRDNSQPKPSSAPTHDSSSDPSYVTVNFADRRPGAANQYRLASLTSREVPSGTRPAVRNAIEALRAMPPEARQRQLSSGRYATFPAQERRLLENASGVQQVQ